MNRAAFFDFLRRTDVLGPVLTSDEVTGTEAILDACEGWPISWTADALATAYHETAHSMKPVRELGGAEYLRRMYDIDGRRPELAKANGNIHPGDGVKYCGRGYAQLTWRRNYERAEAEIGRPLASQPDLALDPHIAAQVLRHGMEEGWFTGRKLADYLPPAGKATPSQFIMARRIINGVDRAELIAGYALTFQSALRVGEW